MKIGDCVDKTGSVPTSTLASHLECNLVNQTQLEGDKVTQNEAMHWLVWACEC